MREREEGNLARVSFYGYRKKCVRGYVLWPNGILVAERTNSSSLSLPLPIPLPLKFSFTLAASVESFLFISFN